MFNSGDKLPRLEKEHDGRLAHKAKRFNVMGFLNHFDAANDMATVYPCLCVDRV